MLGELVSQGSIALQRRLKRDCHPQLLVIDELGYLSYDHRHADLLFEVITRRYREKSVVVTTNKPFAEWNDVFPNASCVVTLVDRLVHDSEIVTSRQSPTAERGPRSTRPNEERQPSRSRRRHRRPHHPRWCPSPTTPESRRSAALATRHRLRHPRRPPGRPPQGDHRRTRPQARIGPRTAGSVAPGRPPTVPSSSVVTRTPRLSPMISLPHHSRVRFTLGQYSWHQSIPEQGA